MMEEIGNAASVPSKIDAAVDIPVVVISASGAEGGGGGARVAFPESECLPERSTASRGFAW